MLKEIINILSMYDLDEAGLEHALEDFELEKANYLEADPGNEETAIQLGLLMAIADWVITSDKIDEFHEELQSYMTPPFPDFPKGKKLTSNEYFLWLQGHLKSRNPSQGGYELLLISGPTDDFNGALVFSRDTEKVLNLCHELGIQIRKSTDKL